MKGGKKRKKGEEEGKGREDRYTGEGKLVSTDELDDSVTHLLEN